MSLLDENSLVKRMSDDELQGALGQPDSALVNPMLAAIEMSKRGRMRKRAEGLAAAHTDRGTVVNGLLAEANKYGMGGVVRPNRAYADGGIVTRGHSPAQMVSLGMPVSTYEEEEVPPSVVTTPNGQVIDVSKESPMVQDFIRKSQLYGNNNAKDQYGIPRNRSLSMEELIALRENQNRKPGVIEFAKEQMGLGPESDVDRIKREIREGAHESQIETKGAPAEAGPGAVEYGALEIGALPGEADITNSTEGEGVDPMAAPTGRRDRLNKAVALGLMAKSFADNPSFVGGLAGGAASAGQALLADHNRADYNQLQRDIVDRRDIQAEQDRQSRMNIARYNQQGDERIAGARVMASAQKQDEIARMKAFEIAMEYVNADLTMTTAGSDEKRAAAAALAGQIYAQIRSGSASPGAGAVPQPTGNSR